MNSYLGEFPVTYFGFDPDVTKDQVCALAGLPHTGRGAFCMMAVVSHLISAHPWS